MGAVTTALRVFTPPGLVHLALPALSLMQTAATVCHMCIQNRSCHLVLYTTLTKFDEQSIRLDS